MPKTNKSQKGENNGHYKHGGKGTKLYEVWCSMKRRCELPTLASYKYYGGRGISVCNEWKESFIAFKNWAYENGYKQGLSLDRIDNNGNYEPSNCRWVTMKEQANNQNHTLKIEYKGKIKPLTEWAEILGIKRHTLYHRIYKLGWSIERAFSENVSLDRYHRVKGVGEMKTYITYDEAVSLLPETEDIHTFYNTSFGLLGADWSKAEILDKLQKSEIIELTGEAARSMGHGMCAYNKDTKYQKDILFIQTDEEKLSAFDKSEV